MGGTEATVKLRADARFARLPIIAMTAHATLKERQKCLASGMNDHISKPIDPAALFETVGRYYQPPTGVAPPVPAPAPAATVVETEIPTVAGLDTTEGLLRVGGNRKLYRKLLHQFCAEQAAAPEEITEQLRHGERATAERTAHTVKGVAGNLGATAVAAAAGAGEEALRAGADAATVAELHRQLAADLTPLLAGLRAALGDAPAVPTPPPAGPVDPGELRRVVAEMLRCLAEFDAATADCLTAHRGVFAALFPPAELAAFEKDVQGYAFPEAQARLEQAVRNIGPSAPAPG